MTITPIEPIRMTIDPRRYVWCAPVELHGRCYAPGCAETWGLQKHHIVRRSATGGPLDYITIDQLIVPNVCMLCQQHHDNLTGLLGGHMAAIKWEAGAWMWCVPTDDPVPDYVSKLGEGWKIVAPIGAGS